MALLLVLLLLVMLTGGASNQEALGQPLVRAGALVLLSIAVFLGLGFGIGRFRSIALLLAAAFALLLVQQLPVPPSLWSILPGRAMFDPAAAVPALAAGWRPIALVPDNALNALFSLTVPIAAFVLLTAVSPRSLRVLVPALMVMAVLTGVVASFQFAGGGFDNPLINERRGYASGLFANRNHQALFLAIGILATFVWGATPPFRSWRAWVAGAIIIWFTLMILVTGSRAGLALGLIAAIIGAILAIASLKRSGLRLPRLAVVAIVGGGVLLFAGAVAVSLLAERSASIDRLDDAMLAEDMRFRALPVMLRMATDFFPLGAGSGAFEPVFRAYEPDALLKFSYFNHAHNDFLELVIETGLAGIVLLAAALLWFVRATIRVWRAPIDTAALHGRLGSGIILLALLASAVDYPLRTPIFMAVLIVAAVLLCGSTERGSASGH